MDLPAEVRAFAARGPDWAAYVDRLPRLVAELLGEWDLVRDGAPMHGHAALVLPVLADGVEAVLKLGFPDEESEHEGLALQRWGGRSAVRLLRADPHRRALLLERLHPGDLDALGDLEACEVVGGLYGSLHVPAPPQLRTLTSYVARWSAELAVLPRSAPVPRRLVEQAVALSRDLVADADSDATLIHGDLHYQNVLAGDREPWLVIDPKPMAGDPHYEVAPMLWNRWPEALESGDVRDAVRRRFHTLVDAADLDEDRARDWVVVRMLHNALWEIQDGLWEIQDDGQGEWLTTCVTVAKAVQD